MLMSKFHEKNAHNTFLSYFFFQFSNTKFFPLVQKNFVPYNLKILSSIQHFSTFETLQCRTNALLPLH